MYKQILEFEFCIFHYSHDIIETSFIKEQFQWLFELFFGFSLQITFSKIIFLYNPNRRINQPIPKNCIVIKKLFECTNIKI